MTVRLSASTYTALWREDLDGAIASLGPLGVARCEVMAAVPHVDLHVDARDLGARLRAVAARSGVAVVGLNPPGLDLNIATADRAMRDWYIDRYVQVGHVVADAGGRYLVVHPGRRHPFLPAPYAETREWVLDALARIVVGLRSSGVRVLFENTPTAILDTAEECVEVVGAVDVGLVYDVANGLMVEDPVSAVALVAPFVEVVHLSDTRRERWAHDPLGHGDVDVVGVIEALARATPDRDVDLVLETVHPEVTLAEGIGRDLAHLAAVGADAVIGRQGAM
jgi:L-ribulose-5-phosphate 3-epimerase